MLSAYSALMMLLGSLIGISSIYKPANVETQPQPKNIAPNIIVPPNPTAQQALQDRQLVDRLMPEIIKRIDVKLVLTQRPGQIGLVKESVSTWVNLRVPCQPGETAVSAGFNGELGLPTWDVFRMWRVDPNSNVWNMALLFEDGGTVKTYAECLKVELSVRPVTAFQPGSLGYLTELYPSQPKPPTQPPGGPPLQPPPEFGK
jgi:hypothetical protein